MEKLKFLFFFVNTTSYDDFRTFSEGLRVGEKALLKEVLEKLSFTVELDGVVEGFSGIKHRFDLVATKGSLTLCFDFVNLSTYTYLKTWCKALDLRNVKVFLISREGSEDKILSELKESGFLKLVFFKDLKDLVEKVRIIVAKNKDNPLYPHQFKKA